MDPVLVARSLQFYKRREVQEAILRHASDREVSPRYGEGFGKRPDILSYPQDVLEFAKRKATSFHVSEERWENPLDIKTGASRKEMNALRKGWDLVLDIDAKNWDISRITAWLFIEALKKHGVTGISVKFSGNKGWHIGVPFEAFPVTALDERDRDVETKDLFPEIPRIIAAYLLDYIDDTRNGLVKIDESTVTFGPRKYTLEELKGMTGLEKEELLSDFCMPCNKVVALGEEQHTLKCPLLDCQYVAPKRYTREEKELIDMRETICPKCRHGMVFTAVTKHACPHTNLSPRPYFKRFKLESVIQFDTVLIAGRHLYRMAYSLHEKSGLVSVVVDPSEVLAFDKKDAEPKKASFARTFLDPARAVPGEAAPLLHAAMQWYTKREQRKEIAKSKMPLTEFEEVTEATAEEHFPPCMKAILEGMADGKKRAMFALTNFLLVNGWSPEMIERKLYEWNERNGGQGEPLREVIIKGHMHQVRMKKEKILPPNCRSFYQELGVCRPDEFCSRIKNPGPYAIKHSRLGAKAKKARAPRRREVVDGSEKEKPE